MRQERAAIRGLTALLIPELQEFLVANQEVDEFPDLDHPELPYDYSERT